MDSTLHAFTNQSLLAFLVSKFSRGEDLVVLETVAKEFQHCARESVYRQHVQPRSHVVIYLPQLPNDIEPITGALSVATKNFASLTFDLTQQLLDSCLAVNQPITALHIIVTVDPVYNGIACHSNPTSSAASSYQYSFRRSECTERLLQILSVDRWSELVGNICRYNSLKELSVFDATASCIERDNKPFTQFLQLDKLILNYLTNSLESLCVPCCAYTDALLNFMNTKAVTTDSPKIHTLNLSQCKSRGMCLLPERSLGMLFANAATQQYAFKSVRHLVCTGSFDDADVLHMVRQSSMWRERLHSLFPNVESVSMEVLFPGSVGFDADDINDSDDDDDDDDDDDADSHGKQSSVEFFRAVHFQFQTIFIDCSALTAAHINYMLSCFGQYCNRQIVLGLHNHGLTTKRINVNNGNERVAAAASGFETQLHNTLCCSTPRRRQQQQQCLTRNKAALPQLTAVYRQTLKLVSLYYQPRGCFIASRSSENSRPTSWTCTKASIDITLLKPDIEVVTEMLRERFDGLIGACEQQQQHVLQQPCSLQIKTLHYVAEWSDSLPQTQWFASLAQTSYATKIVQNSFWALAQALAATAAPSSSVAKQSPSMPNVLHRLQRLVIRIRFRYGSQPNADKVFGEGFVDAELVKTIARLTLTWPWLLDIRFCIQEELRPSMSNWARSMLVADEQQNSRQCEAGGGSMKQLRLSPLVKALRALQVHGDGSDGNFLCSAADGDDSFAGAVERNMAWLRTMYKRCDNKKHSTFS